MFKNWKVATLTPSRVDTPHGSISISWRCNSDSGLTDQIAEDAARLIAAAPDLMDACLHLSSNCRELKPEEHSPLWKARAAIAKATGEQP